MAKETLNLEVKSNIKSVAKDQKHWNQELKKTEDSIKNVNEEGKETVAEMQILGLSINGLKAAWTSAASGAKFLFRSIKAGIASTGVGLLVLAFGSLATWFTRTKKGAEALSVAFKGIGAAINVIVDRIAKFGSGLGKILSGNIRGGLTDMKSTFKGIGNEILTDTLLAMALQKQLQKLTDSERDLNVETAQRRAEIEQLKMIAEDLTKTEEERLKASKKAFKMESDLLDKRVENAEMAVDIQRTQNGLSEQMAEDLDALAEKEIALANIKGESATKQIELNNKINSIEKEAAAKRKAEEDERKAKNKERSDERLAQIEAEKKAELDRIAAVKLAEEEKAIAEGDAFMERAQRIIALGDANYLNEIADLQFRAEEKLRMEKLAWEDSLEMSSIQLAEKEAIRESFRIREEALAEKRNDKEIAEEQVVADAKAKIRDANINNISAGIGLIKQMAGENKDIMAGAIIAENAMGIAKTIISTQTANIGALASPANILVPGTAAPIIAANNIAAGIAIASSVAAAAQGLSVLGKGGATGGGAGGGATPSAGSSPPASQMMSGSFELGGGQEVEPVQAYVLSDSITDSQNGLAIIRRRATI